MRACVRACERASVRACVRASVSVKQWMYNDLPTLFVVELAYICNRAS